MLKSTWSDHMPFPLAALTEIHGLGTRTFSRAHAVGPNPGLLHPAVPTQVPISMLVPARQAALVSTGSTPSNRMSGLGAQLDPWGFTACVGQRISC